MVYDSYAQGSAVKSLGDKQTALMLNTFNGLKQRVLWKFEGTLPSGVAVGENIRIVKWMPQNDLLGNTANRVYYILCI